MDEDTPEEKQTMEIEGLVERITSLENENKELKRTIQEMATKIGHQDVIASDAVQKLVAMEDAIAKIAQHVQTQSKFNESIKKTANGLENQVKIHQDDFQQVARILQVHEQHIVSHGTASQEMVQYINALIEDTEKKRAWIATLLKESQAQAQILRQHEMGQQAIAGVIKSMMRQQPYHQEQPQQTSPTTTGPVVTVIEEDGDVLNFLGSQNPNSGPPITGIGPLTIKPPRAPRPKDGPKAK